MGSSRTAAACPYHTSHERRHPAHRRHDTIPPAICSFRHDVRRARRIGALLAPALAALALGLLALGAAAFVRVVRRAHALGRVVTNANLSLLDATAQFLGGLKLAMSQNLQSSFIAEFRQTLHELARRQIDYVRQQSRSRIALSTLPTLVGGLLVLVGFGVFHVAAATLIALLVIITRMIGPIGQIQQGVQQLAYVIPTYEKVKELERELAAIPQEQPVPAAAVLPLAEGAIVFDNVFYRHVADDGGTGFVRGIQGVSLTIEAGELVGHHRAIGCRQDDIRRPSGWAVRATAGGDRRRRRGPGRRHARFLARARELHLTGSFSVPRHGSAEPQLG